MNKQCKELFQNGVFNFVFQQNSSLHMTELEHNLENVVLESGKAYELKILFQPSKILLIKNFVSFWLQNF